MRDPGPELSSYDVACVERDGGADIDSNGRNNTNGRAKRRDPF
jgi:hypothetical protein